MPAEIANEPPTETAMEAAANAMPCLCEMPMEGQHTTPCPRVYTYEVAVAMDAYASGAPPLTSCTCADRPGLLHAEVNGASFGIGVLSWWRRPLNRLLSPFDLLVCRWVDWPHDVGCPRRHERGDAGG